MIETASRGFVTVLDTSCSRCQCLFIVIVQARSTNADLVYMPHPPDALPNALRTLPLTRMRARQLGWVRPCGGFQLTVSRCFCFIDTTIVVASYETRRFFQLQRADGDLMPQQAVVVRLILGRRDAPDLGTEARSAGPLQLVLVPSNRHQGANVAVTISPQQEKTL